MSEYEDKSSRKLTREEVEIKMNKPNISQQAGRDTPSERPTPVTNAMVEELQVFLKELSQMEQQLVQQMTNAAVQDNNMVMMETKGMLRLAVMIRQNVEKRIETLFPTTGTKQ